MKTIRSSDLAKNLNKFLDDADPLIVIMKYGKPVKMLVPYDEPDQVPVTRRELPKPMSHPPFHDRYKTIGELQEEDRRKRELLKKINRG